MNIVRTQHAELCHDVEAYQVGLQMREYPCKTNRVRLDRQSRCQSSCQKGRKTDPPAPPKKKKDVNDKLSTPAEYGLYRR
jgi:hypothetical protein